jgi:U3 small nucleolar ribonucleoprotein component
MESLSFPLASPASYISPTEELRSETLASLKSVFALYKKFCSEEPPDLPGTRHIDTGPLTELYTEGLDGDQIWEQLELVNKPVIASLSGVVADLSARLEDGTAQLVQHSDCNVEAISSPTGGEEVTRRSGEDLVTDSGGEEDEEEDLEDQEEEEEEESGCKRVRARCGKASVVDDRFFKLSEMERFVEMAEKEEDRGKRDCYHTRLLFYRS